MPIDQPEAAAPTTRRSFLTRAALGGALVTVGAGPLTRLLPAAGASPAQVDAADELTDEDFATFAIPLELAAAQVYGRAQRTGLLDAEWSELTLRFQGHHLEVAETLSTLVTSGDGDLEADEVVLDGSGGAVEGAGDQDEVLAALAELESVLAATHLFALGGLADRLTAQTVAQVCSTESQQAAVLALGAGTDVEELTPATVTTDGALTGADDDVPPGDGATDPADTDEENGT